MCCGLMLYSFSGSSWRLLNLAEKVELAEKKAMEAEKKVATSSAKVVVLKAEVISGRVRAEKLKAEVASSQGDLLRAIVERVLLSGRFSKMANEIAAILNTSIRAD